MSRFKRSIKTVTLTPLEVFPLEKKVTSVSGSKQRSWPKRCEKSRGRESTVVSPGTFYVKQNAMKKVFSWSTPCFLPPPRGFLTSAWASFARPLTPISLILLLLRYELTAKGCVTECLRTSNWKAIKGNWVLLVGEG